MPRCMGEYETQSATDQTKAIEKPQVQHRSAMPDTSWIHHRFGFQLISVYYSETSHCCQIFATHPHPTFSVRLPCPVLARSLKSWILCYDIEIEPQRLNSSCSLLLICIENKGEFARISNVMLWSRAVGPEIKEPENKRI